MKKLILITLVITGISGAVFASTHDKDCNGANHFLENLNLDEERAHEAGEIMGSYKQVKELAKNGQFDQIPAFIEATNVKLAEVLTEEEMQQLKENVGEWSKSKDFSKYKKFAGKFVNKQH